MSVKNLFRTHRRDNFTTLPNELLRNAQLSFKARGMMALIFSNIDAWEVHHSWLADQGTEGREAISSGMQELERHGYACYREERNAAGQFSASVWEFFDFPIEEAERTNRTRWNPRPGNPQAGLPRDGKPYYGNPQDGNPTAKKTIQKEDYPKEDHTRQMEGDFFLAASREPIPKTPICEASCKIASLFNRRVSTQWSEKEITAFRAVKGMEIEEIETVRRYYEAERLKPRGIHRRDMLTFLNNYRGEVDRANEWAAKESRRKPDPEDDRAF